MSARDDELRMHAYYYGFAATGVPEIDKILSAVACAGKAYHHTDSWSEDAEWPPHQGKCPIEWIQNAANEAAAKWREHQLMKKSLFTWKEKIPFLYIFSMILVCILCAAWACPFVWMKVAFLAMAPLPIFALYNVATS